MARAPRQRWPLQKRALAGAALILGALAALSFAWRGDPGPRMAAPVCRPSDPGAYLAAHDGTVLLLFGNSLLFDHNWRLPGVVAINCARQGQTAQEAVAAVGHLPAITPDAVLLGFGSVEALRAGRAGRALDPEAAAEAVMAIAATLRQRWPDSRILALSVPVVPGAPSDIRPGDAAALNTALAARPGAPEMLDVNRLSAPGGPELYDGIHLSRRAYARLEAALAALLAEAR